MTAWLDEKASIYLAALFLVHLIAFVFLSIRRKSLQYCSSILTFLMLTLLNLAKAQSFNPTAGYLDLQDTLRVLAWLFAGLSVALFIRRKRSVA